MWLLVIWEVKKNVFEDINLKENKNLDCMSLSLLDFPGGTSGKEPICQCRRYKRLRIDPWVGKIPCRRARQPTPVFLPGESNRQRSLVGYSPWRCKSRTWLKWLSTQSWHRLSLGNSTYTNRALEASEASEPETTANIKHCQPLLPDTR